MMRGAPVDAPNRASGCPDECQEGEISEDVGLQACSRAVSIANFWGFGCDNPGLARIVISESVTMKTVRKTRKTTWKDEDEVHRKCCGRWIGRVGLHSTISHSNFCPKILLEILG